MVLFVCEGGGGEEESDNPLLVARMCVHAMLIIYAATTFGI